jgi:hypothetical protein
VKLTRLFSLLLDDPYDLDGEDSWVRQAGTGEDGGQEGLPGALLGAGSSSDIPAEAPPQLAGKKRVLPAAMARATSAQRPSAQPRGRGVGKAP